MALPLKRMLAVCIWHVKILDVDWEMRVWLIRSAWVCCFFNDFDVIDLTHEFGLALNYTCSRCHEVNRSCNFLIASWALYELCIVAVTRWLCMGWRIYRDPVAVKNRLWILTQMGFFDNICVLSNILKPIKEAILILESTKTNLADCYLHLFCITAFF